MAVGWYRQYKVTLENEKQVEEDLRARGEGEFADLVHTCTVRHDVGDTAGSMILIKDLSEAYPEPYWELDEFRDSIWEQKYELVYGPVKYEVHMVEADFDTVDEPAPATVRDYE